MRADHDTEADLDVGTLETVPIECPNCGKGIDLVVDCSAGSQSYIEDCHVCCRPISVAVSVDSDGVPMVEARHEDD